MSLLDRARTRRPSDPASPGPGPWSWSLLVPGARAAVSTWLLLVLPALLVWVVAPLSTVSWLQAVGVASAGWFLGHGLPVSLGRTTIGLVPLGVTLLVLVVTTRSTSRLLDESESASRGTTWPTRLRRRLLPGYAAGYLGVALVAWVTTLAGPVRPAPLAVPAALVVPLVAVLVSLVRRHGRDEEAPWVGPLLERAPRWLSRAIGPGVRGAGLLGLAGLVVVVGALLLRLGVVTGLHAALDPGVVGGALLVVGQVLVVPDLAVWGLSWLAGPGFSLGDGAAVTLTGSHPGLLPLVPVLGALPTGGALPGWVLPLLAVPVLVGAVVSWLSCRRLARLSSGRTKLETSGAACVVTALLVLVATLLASGSLGVQRLSHVGPDPWLVTLAVLGELMVGALAHLGLVRLLQRR